MILNKVLILIILNIHNKCSIQIYEELELTIDIKI